MAKTLENIIDSVEFELSQIAGYGTQIYSEDIIAKKIQKIFNIVFDEVWWEPYMQWYTGTLDGTNGVVTLDVSAIKRYEDIRVVFRSDSDSPLVEFPSSLNPTRVTGTQALYTEALGVNDANVAKIFRVLPVTATGNLDFHARLKPDDFALTDEIHMDEDVLALGAAWDYIEGDGTSPSDAQRLQNEFDTRLKQLKKLRSSKPLTLSRPRVDIPDRWFSNET